eukprot:COSAG02_NODE_670_length_18676_cov_29.852029_2_plen_219_part_00
MSARQPSFWLSAQNLQIPQNNGTLFQFNAIHSCFGQIRNYCGRVIRITSWGLRIVPTARSGGHRRTLVWPIHHSLATVSRICTLYVSQYINHFVWSADSASDCVFDRCDFCRVFFGSVGRRLGLGRRLLLGWWLLLGRFIGVVDRSGQWRAYTGAGAGAGAGGADAASEQELAGGLQRHLARLVSGGGCDLADAWAGQPCGRWRPGGRRGGAWDVRAG